MTNVIGMPRYKRICIGIDISTLTKLEIADEINCSLDITFPNKDFSFLDVTLALFELEKAKEFLIKAGSTMETKLYGGETKNEKEKM